MSVLKNLSVTSGVFMAVFILSMVSAQDELELSSQSDLESMDEIQELLRNVQMLYEKKIASKVHQGAVQEAMDGEKDAQSCPRGCRCWGLSCSCCQYMCIRKLNITGNTCLTVSYIPQKWTLHVTLKIGCRLIFSKQLSAKCPPPVCAGISCFKPGASACIRFYSVRFYSRCYTGCVQFEARLGCRVVARVNLGCFRIRFRSTTQEIGAEELPYLDGQQAPLEGSETLSFDEVPMENIEPSDIEQN